MKIVETERLILKTLGDECFEELADLLANEKVHRFFPKVLNKKESREFLRNVQTRQNEDGFSFWGVFRKKDSTFLGICGLLKQFIDGTEETEVSYRINECFWGKGYGTEAAEGCINYARTELGASSIISLILPENRPSIRVAEKNGLRYEKDSMYQGQTHRVYRLHLEEPLNKHIRK